MDALDALLRSLQDEVLDPEEGDSRTKHGDARPQEHVR